MRVSDLDYDLPEELIAQQPALRRDEARLLVVNRKNGSLHDAIFCDTPEFLRAGDCLVLNDTEVLRARLEGHKTAGGKVEIFLLRELDHGWEALVRPSAKVAEGATVTVSKNVFATVLEGLPGGKRRVTFNVSDVIGMLKREGHIPLPPYIRRQEEDAGDSARYQTVYAARPGAVAAPTAGLHFTDDLFRSLEARGVDKVMLTLHVGYGTFKPIQTEDLEQHTVDAEDFELSEEAATQLEETRRSGGRIVAVGTTTARALETQLRDRKFQAGRGRTTKYIYPPYTFLGVDALITNFHLPRSSLLALVMAFAGRELVLEAYRHAVAKSYRFYSYGDAMLIV